MQLLVKQRRAHFQAGKGAGEMMEGRLEWGKVTGQGKRGDGDWRATGTVIGDQYFFTLYVNGFDRMNHQLVIQLFGSCRKD